MGDLKIIDNGGDVDFHLVDPITFKEGVPSTDNADVYSDSSIYNAIYLSLFEGDAWYKTLATPGTTTADRGGFEAELNKPITGSSLKNIKSAAHVALDWLVKDKVVSKLDIEVSNPTNSVINVDIYTEEPNGVKRQFKTLWSADSRDMSEIFISSEV